MQYLSVPTIGSYPQVLPEQTMLPLEYFAGVKVVPAPYVTFPTQMQTPFSVAHRPAADGIPTLGWYVPGRHNVQLSADRPV